MSEHWFDRFVRNPSLLPPHLRSNNGGAQVLAMLAERRASERLPASELTDRQRADLLTLAHHATTYSPHFATRLAAAGLTPAKLAEPGGLEKLPPLTRRELAGSGESFFCQAYPSSHGDASKLPPPVPPANR